MYEDGFIRSVGLGVDVSPSFSLVEDDIGIYYDATTLSKLENLLNTYAFVSDVHLMSEASRAIEMILEHNVSKYNSAPAVNRGFCSKYGLTDKKSSVLVIAQTAGDSSLAYGMLEPFTTDEMIEAAVKDNPDATVYLKIHPDVISGKKCSDVDVKKAREQCVIIDEDVNPISLLKHMQKVYTKTSGMGFEALLCGCECVCFGMPFYAGWGLTTDKSVCSRRQRSLSVEEVFAAAYILYTRYVDPESKKEIDIFETMQRIIEMRERA